MLYTSQAFGIQSEIDRIRIIHFRKNINNVVLYLFCLINIYIFLFFLHNSYFVLYIPCYLTKGRSGLLTDCNLWHEERYVIFHNKMFADFPITYRGFSWKIIFNLKRFKLQGGGRTAPPVPPDFIVFDLSPLSFMILKTLFISIHKSILDTPRDEAKFRDLFHRRWFSIFFWFPLRKTLFRKIRLFPLKMFFC